MRARRAALVSTRLAFALTLLAVPACRHDDGEREDHIEANQWLLEKVPIFPGAEKAAERHAPYFAGDRADAPVAGYTTTHVYDLPAGASRGEVARFYRARLVPEWLLQDELVEPRGERVLNFRREDAILSVNLENRRVLELTANHNGSAER